MARTLRRVLGWIVGLAVVAGMVELIAQAVYRYLILSYEQLIRTYLDSPSPWTDERVWVYGTEEQEVYATTVVSVPYPWSEIDLVMYTHVCALLICIVLMAIGWVVYLTVTHFKAQHSPIAVSRQGGMSIREYRTSDQRAAFSRSFVLDVCATLLMIGVLCMIIEALLTPTL